MRRNSILIYILTASMLCQTSCKKSNFLDEKPDDALVIPSSLKDFQALLDNDILMNGERSFGLTPALGEMGTADYYFNPALVNNIFTPQYRNIYTWNSTIFDGTTSPYDWAKQYRSVFYSNVVLDGLAKINQTPLNQEEWKSIKGSALFFRAHALYQLAQVFAPPYKSETSTSDLGVPLKVSSDISEPIKRANLFDTYKQIIDDLMQSIEELPVIPKYKTRPSKPAAYGLLARVYQTMRDYPNSVKYATECLKLYNTLLSFNSIMKPTLPNYPFARYNDEVIFACIISSDQGILIRGSAAIDSTLYRAYESGDLRKYLFYSKNNFGGYTFRGSYDGTNSQFTGIASDEIYLIRAEGLARQGDLPGARSDLNKLLENRWDPAVFVPVDINDQKVLIDKILVERRKELFMRGVRWTDLRRLNTEGYNISQSRVFEGQTYTLLPNDPKYVYPIPPEVISFNPDMPQNIR